MSTPIVPRNLPSPLPNTLRTSVSTALLSSHASIPTIQRTFSNALDSSGWTKRLNERVLELLRSGECTSYEDIMQRILQESGRQASSGPRSRRVSSVNRSLEVPDGAVEEGIKAVEIELEKAGIRVEEEE